MDAMAVKKYIETNALALAFANGRYSLFFALCEAWQNKLRFERLVKSMLSEACAKSANFSSAEKAGLEQIAELRSKWGQKRATRALANGAGHAAAEGHAHDVNEKILALIAKLVQSDEMAFLPELKKFGYSPDSPDRDGTTLLMNAAQSGALKCIMALIKEGAGIDVQDIAGNTALMWACAFSQTNSAKALLHFGADPFIRNHSGIGPLTMALTKGNFGLADLLIEYGASIHECDAAGNSALHRSVMLNNKKMFDYLMDCGANPYGSNKAGMTVARLARSKPEFAEALAKEIAADEVGDYGCTRRRHA